LRRTVALKCFLAASLVMREWDCPNNTPT
jgi:hypothetical protein